MNKIISKTQLAENVNSYVIEAERIVKHARPGQFVIMRIDENGERLPFTIYDMDKEKGTITLLVQTVGYSTAKLAAMEAGDYIHDFAGPLGNATDLDAYDRVLLVGGGIGAAVIYPQAQYLMWKGKPADTILGARTASLILNESAFKKSSRNLYVVTDDGTRGEKGFVTDKIKQLLDSGEKYDCVFAVGPMMMMRAVSNLTREYGVHTIVSMNSVMVDGTGMCGGCRVTVDGETKYACVDGPEFDGHKIDFDEAINRSRFYQEHEHKCKLRGIK